MAAQLLTPYAKRAYNRARRPMIGSVQLLQFIAVQKDTGLAVRFDSNRNYRASRTAL